MKKHFLNIILAVIASLVVGCKSGPELPMETLSVDHEAIIAESMGAEYSLSVVSNTSWEVIDKDINWVSITLSKATGNSSFLLTVAPNESDEARNAVVLVRSVSDPSFYREIKIEQSGKTSAGYVSISSLRAMEKAGSSISLTSTAKVKGYVVSNAIASNYFENAVAIEDSFTSGGSGITVIIPSGTEAVAQGEEVGVELNEAELSRNSEGFLTLKPKIAPVKTSATKINLKPLILTYQQLSSGDYESMYVCSQLQVVETAIGGTLTESPLMEDASGNNVKLVVSDNAAFASNSYQEGVGSVCGISGPKASVPELRPTGAEDLAFTSTRIGVEPGIRKLPYILSLYARTQTNKDLKYSTATADGTYDKLGTDFFISDADKKIGAYITAKCSDLMTYSGQFRMSHWADQGAHDNIPGKSFTADNGSGYYFAAPIQMDGFPRTFHVAFGMGGTGGCLRNWILWYSDDNKTWIEGPHYQITTPMAYSGWMYYYDLVLTTNEEFAKGSTLYLRWTPTGDAAVKAGVTTTGLSSDCRFCCCCAIFADYSATTSRPSGAIYFEPFDLLTEGMDYLWGDRLAAMMNFCGNDISKWSAEQKNGLTGDNVHQRRGYAQIGYVESQEVARNSYVNTLGHLTTPVLGAAGDLKLSFDAMAYLTPSLRPSGSTTEPADKKGDLKTIVVKVLGGGTINGASEATISDLSTSEFANYSLEIKGATVNTQIQFTSAPGSGDFSRWFIDNILVTK
jgi:hypothetical protein